MDKRKLLARIINNPRSVRFSDAVALVEAFAMLSKEQLTEVKSESIEAFRGYSTERGMSFPAEVLIVSGTKSRPA